MTEHNTPPTPTGQSPRPPLNAYGRAAQAALHRLPAGLSARPRDRRGLPVPFVQGYDEVGEPDFTLIDANAVLKCAKGRLCGLCGRKLGSRVSFLGGPKAASNRGGAGAYMDPPMHPECADAALTLCPHIAVQHALRNWKNPDAPWDIVTPEHLDLTKPTAWIMLTARAFDFQVTPAQGILFFPQPGSTRRTFTYDPATHALNETQT